MQYTSNFNFNLPEGTDLWNYLTQTNPNFTTLDSILKGVQDGTVTTATEVTSGTAHAVTRTLPDANVIRFTATGVWTLGDTMTIDGTPVTVVKPNGTNLQTGDYVIGVEVLGVLRASQFTVYLGAPSSLDAADISYVNTGSGLTATDVQDAIDEVNSNLYNKQGKIDYSNPTVVNPGGSFTPSYTATADGVLCIRATGGGTDTSAMTVTIGSTVMQMGGGQSLMFPIYNGQTATFTNLVGVTGTIITFIPVVS